MTLWPNFKNLTFVSPNGLSFLRGVLGAVLFFLLISPNPYLHLLAPFIFAFAAITDYWDGALARRLGHVSNFGKILDPSMDKILILVPMATFASLGLFSMWWVVPIFVREMVVTFCRIGWLIEGKAIGAEKVGKLKFVIQVLCLACIFSYFISYDFPILEKTRQLIAAGMTLSLVVTIILTLFSGYSFVKSNLANFESPGFARFVGALGVGFLPWMPGTWGSAFSLVLVWLAHWNGWLYAGMFLFLLWIGHWAVSRIDLSTDKDPQFVVVDEACGIFITFLGIRPTPVALAAGFLLFRLFDVLKPFPIRRLEKFPGYWGILFDDLGAAVYAWIVMFVFFR